jgi:large subunit ribosomal protein L15
MELNSLENASRPWKRRRRVGRGVGSGLGKTCGRGHKGAGSRSGWKSRERYEGGQIPLYRKLPVRGFTRGRFQKKLSGINLAQVDKLFVSGETVNMETLRRCGLIKGNAFGIKILAIGELTKKIHFEVQGISKQAKEKLQKVGATYSIV